MRYSVLKNYLHLCSLLCQKDVGNKELVDYRGLKLNKFLTIDFFENFFHFPSELSSILKFSPFQFPQDFWHFELDFMSLHLGVRVCQQLFQNLFTLFKDFIGSISIQFCIKIGLTSGPWYSLFLLYSWQIFINAPIIFKHLRKSFFSCWGPLLRWTLRSSIDILIIYLILLLSCPKWPELVFFQLIWHCLRSVKVLTLFLFPVESMFIVSGDLLRGLFNLLMESTSINLNLTGSILLRIAACNASSSMALVSSTL
jgi:hypothetical protein